MKILNKIFGKAESKTVLKALQDQRPDLAKELISQKGDLQHRDDYGATAIHYAAALGYLDVLQMLVSRGVNLEIRNHEGQTPLMYAMSYYQFEAAKILWDHQQKTVIIRGDNTFIKLIKELCTIGVDCSWKEGEASSGFYQKGSTNDEKYVIHPRAIEIGKILNELGGFDLMQDAARAVQKILGQNANDLNWAWHGIGDWLA